MRKVGTPKYVEYNDPASASVLADQESDPRGAFLQHGPPEQHNEDSKKKKDGIFIGGLVGNTKKAFWNGFEKSALDGYDAKKCQEHAQNIMTKKLEPQLQQMEAQSVAMEQQSQAQEPQQPKGEQGKLKAEEKVKERKVITEKFAAKIREIRCLNNI